MKRDVAKLVGSFGRLARASESLDDFRYTNAFFSSKECDSVGPSPEASGWPQYLHLSEKLSVGLHRFLNNMVESGSKLSLETILASVSRNLG